MQMAPSSATFLSHYDLCLWDFGPGISMPPRPSWAPGMLPPPAGFPPFSLISFGDSERAELRTWHSAQGKAHLPRGWRGQGVDAGNNREGSFVIMKLFSVWFTFIFYTGEEITMNKWEGQSERRRLLLTQRGHWPPAPGREGPCSEPATLWAQLCAK